MSQSIHVSRPLCSGLLGLLIGAASLCAAAPCQAGDVHRSLNLSELEIVAGALPGRFPAVWTVGAVLDSPEDGDRALVLVPSGPRRFGENALECRLVARVSSEDALSGRLFLPRFDLSGMDQVAFRIPAGADSESARADFRAAELQHAQRMLLAGVPGSAWFRLQAHQLDGRDEAQRIPTTGRESEMQRTLSMFSGARAISENLQLDRLLQVGDHGLATVDVDGISGLTVRPYDWTARVAGLELTPDALAACLPSDQHAVFFRSFDALVETIDELDRSGTPLRLLLEDQATDSFTRARYERQLCLHLNQLTRKLGPLLIDSVALTGSDPYLRTGSDVALLFRTGRPEALLALIATAQQAAQHPEAVPVSGTIGSLEYCGVRSPDRSICSLVARHGDVVLVTNSTAQIEAFAEVKDGRREALASLDEYRFFRHRYPVGADGESALLILTDATIRRWCGPRWRIAASRRIRAAALMAHSRSLEIEKLADRSSGVVPPPFVARVYGNLEFLTPIAELEFETVTPAEAAAYENFRGNYQREWRQFFDPIALRFSVKPDGGFASDLTVLPLIAESDFREFMEVSQGVALEPKAGDVHEEALVHFTQAVNLDSPPLREMGEFMKGMRIGLDLHPLSWMDGSFSIYVDDDPLFDQLHEAEDPKEFIEANFGSGLPIALNAEVKDPMRLAAFLTAMRSFIELSAPGVVEWQTLKHEEQTYVKGLLSEQFQNGDQRVSLYYAVLPGRFTITLDERLIHRVIDRAKAQADARELPEWNGRSLAVRLDGRALRILEGLIGPWHEQNLRAACWRNLPILNEWKRLFPDQDPVAFHRRQFHQELICPGGGEYVWNEEYRSMESTAFGLPARPRSDARIPSLFDALKSARLGVTFEEDGLRARFDLERCAK